MVPRTSASATGPGPVVSGGLLTSDGSAASPFRPPTDGPSRPPPSFIIPLDPNAPSPGSALAPILLTLLGARLISLTSGAGGSRLAPLPLPPLLLALPPPPLLLPTFELCCRRLGRTGVAARLPPALGRLLGCGESSMGESPVGASDGGLGSGSCSGPMSGSSSSGSSAGERAFAGEGSGLVSVVAALPGESEASAGSVGGERGRAGGTSSSPPLVVVFLLRGGPGARPFSARSESLTLPGRGGSADPAGPSSLSCREGFFAWISKTGRVTR